MRFFALIAIIILSQPLAAQWEVDQDYGDSGHAFVDEAWFEYPVGIVSFPDHEMLLSQWIHQDDLTGSSIGVTLIDHEGFILDAFEINHPNYDHILPNELLQLGDNRVLISGKCFHTSLPDQVDPFVLALNSDGTLDNSFGEEGWLITEFIGHDEVLYGLASAGDQIVVAGMSLDSNYIHKETPVLMMFDQEGQVIESFGAHGKIALDFSNNSVNDTIRHEDGGFFESVILTENRIYAAGAYSNSIYNTCLVAAFDMNGQLDESFNQDGILTFDYTPNANNWINALHITDANELIANVYSEGETDGSISLVRINLEGVINGVTEINANAELVFESMRPLEDQNWMLATRYLAGPTNAFQSDELAFFTLNSAATDVMESFHIDAGLTTLTSMELCQNVNGEVYLFAYAEGNSTDEYVFRFSYYTLVEEALVDFSVYPNPASSILHVVGEGSYQLLDINGREVEHFDVLTESTAIDVSSLPNGCYFISRNGSAVKKLLIGLPIGR